MFKKILLLSLIFTLLTYSVCFAAASKTLVNKLTKGLEEIKNWIIKLATPAAAVAIGSGVLMKKFSFGDEEKIIMGKKLIKSTLFSYAFVLCTDMILTTISSLVK